MASTDAKPIPQKNVAYRVTFPIYDADGDLVTGATGLDSEISKDGGTFADCTNEATEIATSSGIYYLDLTSTEMNADTVAVIVKTTSSGAKTTPIIMYPEEAGDIRVNVTQFGGTNGTFASGRPEVNTTHAAGTAWNSGAIGAATLATDTITAAKIAANAIGSSEVADGFITSAKFATGAITATVIAADAIGASELAADAVTEIATGVWASAARTLTALDEDSTTIDLDATVRAAIGLASANLDTQLGALPTAAENADAVWDEDLSTHTTAGTAGKILSDAGAAGDPWGTALPGAYSAGQAGYIIGTNVDATISSRATQTSVDDLPTNAELTTALATADDAVLAAVAIVDGNVDAIKVKTDNLPTDPADASVISDRFDILDTSVADLPTNAELTSALATSDDAVLAAVAVVDGNVDAIKAKTDSLSFTVAGQIDANIKYVNNVGVDGAGTVGDPWGPV